MSQQTKEKQFEANIEESLLSAGGYAAVSRDDWDKSISLFPRQVCEFIQRTQSKLWEEISEPQGLSGNAA